NFGAPFSVGDIGDVRRGGPRSTGIELSPVGAGSDVYGRAGADHGSRMSDGRPRMSSRAVVRVAARGGDVVVSGRGGRNPSQGEADGQDQQGEEPVKFVQSETSVRCYISASSFSSHALRYLQSRPLGGTLAVTLGLVG